MLFFLFSTLSEKRTLENLTASMKAANEILERRRSERSRDSGGGSNSGSGSGTSSRYVEYSLPQNKERGRPTSRYSTLPTTTSTLTSYRSSSGSTSDPTGTGSGSLWGLLDMAQSWLMSHTSRRDRSEERSRYLLRKTSKPVWFFEPSWIL